MNLYNVILSQDIEAESEEEAELLAKQNAYAADVDITQMDIPVDEEE